MAEWISVNDRLPSICEDVLMYFDAGNMAVGFLRDTDKTLSFWSAYTDDGWYTDCDSIPLYWMTLPEPPIKCKHCFITKRNNIGEVVCFCEEWSEWKNVTLGDCLGNCEKQEI